MCACTVRAWTIQQKKKVSCNRRGCDKDLHGSFENRCPVESLVTWNAVDCVHNERSLSLAWSRQRSAWLSAKWVWSGLCLGVTEVYDWTEGPLLTRMTASLIPVCLAAQFAREEETWGGGRVQFGNLTRSLIKRKNWNGYTCMCIIVSSKCWEVASDGVCVCVYIYIYIFFFFFCAHKRRSFFFWPFSSSFNLWTISSFCGLSSFILRTIPSSFCGRLLHSVTLLLHCLGSSKRQWGSGEVG